MMILSNAHLIDGTGEPPVDDATVILDGFHIEGLNVRPTVPEVPTASTSAASRCCPD